jgi:hypothetical protein
MFQGAKPRAFLLAAALTSLQLLLSPHLEVPWGMVALAPGSLFALFAFAPVGFAGPAGYLSAAVANLVFWYWIAVFVLERRRPGSSHL